MLLFTRTHIRTRTHTHYGLEKERKDIAAALVTVSPQSGVTRVSIAERGACTRPAGETERPRRRLLLRGRRRTESEKRPARRTVYRARVTDVRPSESISRSNARPVPARLAGLKASPPPQDGRVRKNDGPGDTAGGPGTGLSSVRPYSDPFTHDTRRRHCFKTRWLFIPFPHLRWGTDKRSLLRCPYVFFSIQMRFNVNCYIPTVKLTPSYNITPS